MAIRSLSGIAPLFLLLFLHLASAQAATPVKAAMLLNLSNGKILYEMNADRKVAPASLTKIMTMFLTLDAIRSGRIKLKDKVRISPEAAKIGGSIMHLNPGDTAPVVRLLAGTAVASGNDAATALAGHVGGSIQNFVQQMNRKAAALGMKRTQFKNPTGLPAAGQKTTARDLSLLCKAYLKNRPEGRRFHAMTNFMHKGRVIHNTNSLLGRIPGVTGLKTGWTVASGYNLIVTATKGKANLLAIILGAPNKQSRDAMAIRLIEAGYSYPNSPAQVKKFMNMKK